jgi:hypothetical protein
MTRSISSHVSLVVVDISDINPGNDEDQIWKYE